MVDTSWEIHTGDNTAIVADAVLSDPSDSNTITRGETASYVFTNILNKFTVENGETYTIPIGETERYDLVVVNGTLEINGTLECDQIEINGSVIGSGTLKVDDDFAFELADVEPYSEYAGKFSPIETLGAKQRYKENFTDPELDTLLVGVEPQARLERKTIEGYWGLISNITDERNRPLSNNQVEIEITVLAPYDEYDDHTAVQTDLEVTL